MSDAVQKLAPESFPPLLSEITDPPAKLYIRGTLPPEDHVLLAVVGSRRYSNYGKEACEHLIAGLAGYSRDMVIVQTVVSRVLTALCAPVPCPDFGDDGYRDDVRNTATEALDWAERWIKVRESAHWDSNQRFSFGDDLPEPK